jgi:phosphohistidine swiveling domain-containing protein
MSYKNYKWEVCANDYNSPYLRNWLWTHSFFKYPKLLGVSRAVLGIASRDNRIEYLADFSTWTKAHEELKAQVMKNPKVFENLINKSVVWGEKMNQWTEKEIFKKDLSKLSSQKLVALLYGFVDMQEDEYAYGTALPILDFIGLSFVEGNLVKFLKSKVSEENYQKYYSVFTEPENNSFAQDQEEDLLKLMKGFWKDGQWQSDVKEKSLDEVKNKYPRFYSKLREHTLKHGWVYYVYMGPAFTEKDFLNFIKDYLNKGVNPAAKLAELQKKKGEIKKMKRACIKELKPDNFNKFILNIAGKVVWAKPRRKDYQSRSYYHIEKLMREIAGRLSISLEQARSAPYELLSKALDGKKVDWKLADTIKAFHICLPNDDGTIAILTGNEAEDFSNNRIKRAKDSEQSISIKEIKGATACVGYARGVVKIINVPEDMSKMEYGDILVSTATTPSVVPAMKKAAAIVTNEGGLTCHAAIVSRELGIPCIIGTKIATKVLKDGDIVEVDAEKGIVKIVKQS